MIETTRLGDWWQYGIHLRAKCECGADRQIPPDRVLKFFGGQEHRWREGGDNERIAKVLVCGSCKRKGRAAVRVVRD